MVSDKTHQHPMGDTPRLMTILPYKLATTNDQLTSRAGLLAVGQTSTKPMGKASIGPQPGGQFLWAFKI